MVILESSRITSATRIRGNTTRKVIILQHIAFAIVSFNIIHGLIMFLLSSTFASLIFQFPSFAIFWAISLIAALFALKNKKVFLLYPMLLAETPLILVSLCIWLFHLTNMFYCVFIRHNSKSNTESSDILLITEPEEDVQQNFLSCHMAAASYVDHHFSFTPISIFSAIVFFLIFIKSLLEFLLFRRLMKLFQLLAEEKRRNVMVDVIDTQYGATNGQLQKENDKDVVESDDDMVVFEKINRQLQFKDNSRLRDYSINNFQPSSYSSKPSLPAVIKSKRTLK